MKEMHLALRELSAKHPDLPVEWRVSESQKTECYYEAGRVAMIRTLFGKDLFLRVIENQKIGELHLNQFQVEKAADYLEAARQLALHSQADPYQEISDEEASYDGEKGSLRAERDAMMQRMIEFLEEMKEFPLIHLETAGLSHRFVRRLIGSSQGTLLTEQQGYYEFSAMFLGRDEEKSSSFNHYGFLLEHLKEPILSHPLLRRLMEDTQKQIHPVVPEEALQGSVIMSPGCLGNFLFYLSRCAMSDQAFINHSSPWIGGLGEQLASDKLTLKNDHQLLGASGITSEGYLAIDQTLLERGVLKNVLLSRYGARRTGNSASGSSGFYPVVEAGEESLDQMIQNTPQGMLMHRFSGGHPDEMGNFSGVAKNSFAIREGEVREALSEVMIRGNLFDLIRGIEAIGDTLIEDGESRLPWMKFNNIQILRK